MRMHLLPALFALALLPSSALAETYTWKDKDGRVHFGDRPPPEMRDQAEEVDIRSKSPGDGSQAREVQQRANRLFEATHKTREAEQKQQAREQAVRDSRCAEVRQQADTLAGRVYFEDAEGKHYTVSEQERRQRLQEKQTWIVENCR